VLKVGHKDVQIAGNMVAVINVVLCIAVRKHVAVTLTLQVYKVKPFKLSSAVCGDKLTHRLQQQQVLDQIWAHTGVSGAVAKVGHAQCSRAVADYQLLHQQTHAAIQHLEQVV
jgi:hypothetical protein